jgi:hypothetical protein
MSPKDHAVQFFQDEGSLVETVSTFAREGLRRDETVMILATASHHAQLRQALFTAPDFDACLDRYLCFDAADCLLRFMVKNWPDEEQFKKFIGGLLYHLTAQGGRVRIYGEMVSLLWADEKRGAAIRLEELWNRLAIQVDFSLLCGYPLADFDRMDDRGLDVICNLHSHIHGQAGRFRKRPIGDL